MKLLKIFIPVISGIMSVLVLLFIYNLLFHNGDILQRPDNGFLTLFVPVTLLVALIIQYLLVLPLFSKINPYGKLLGMSMFQLSVVMILLSGIIFGFVFWERDLGISELIWVTLTGIVAFSVYWFVNLFILKNLD